MVITIRVLPVFAPSRAEDTGQDDDEHDAGSDGSGPDVEVLPREEPRRGGRRPRPTRRHAPRRLGRRVRGHSRRSAGRWEGGLTRACPPCGGDGGGDGCGCGGCVWFGRGCLVSQRCRCHGWRACLNPGVVGAGCCVSLEGGRDCRGV